MNRRNMILRPLTTILVFITILVSFSSASYAVQAPSIYTTPTIQVTATPQQVGVNDLSNVIVKPVALSKWNPPCPVDGIVEVDLHYSGPGQATLNPAGGAPDGNGQFLSTFKADKAGEYTIYASWVYCIWNDSNPNHYDNYYANNSTKIIVTSGGFFFNPKASLSTVVISATPSPSPSPGFHDVGANLNPPGFTGLGSNDTSNQTPQASNDTSGQTAQPAQSSTASSSGNTTQDLQQPASAASPIASPGTPSPSSTASMMPSSTPQQSGSGDTGSTTTYLLIAVVALIAIVGIMGGYILGKGKK